MVDLADVPNWVSGLIGAATGGAIALGKDAVGARPRLHARFSDLQEYTWIREDRPSRRWLVADVADAHEFIVTVDVILVNYSGRDNAILSSTLTTYDKQVVESRIYLDELFAGVNVPAHSVVRQRLRFALKVADVHWLQEHVWNATRMVPTTMRMEAMRGRNHHMNLNLKTLRRNRQPSEDASFLFKH